HLAAARGRENLTIRSELHIDRVLIESQRAIAVRTVEKSETIHGGQIILAAGAYNSPAILLRSGIGAAAQLAALGIAVCEDLPGVGRNLADHPRLRVRFAAAARATEVPGCQAAMTLH